MLNSTGWRSIAELCGVQVVFWTLAGYFAHDAPPLDVVENSLWGPLWLISSPKNPALSSWVLEIARQLTGVVGWPAYLVSELFVAATFAFVYALGRPVMGERRALAGTLLLTGVYYFSWQTIEFNQDIAQLPFWAGAALAAWRAVETRRIVWWLLLGVFGVGAIYAKLSAVVLLIAIAGWLIFDGKARASLRTAGPWAGLGLFLAGVFPLAHWLVVNHFPTLSYAVGRGNHHAIPVLAFPFHQLLALGGLLAILGIAGLYRHAAADDAAASEDDANGPVDPRFVWYLAVLTLAPQAVAMAMAAASGAGMRPMWGVPMLNLAGLLAISLASARFNAAVLRRIRMSALTLLIALPVVYAITAFAPLVIREAAFSGSGEEATYWHRRQNWPQKQIAATMNEIWTKSTGRPLTLIVSDNWVGGLIATALNPMPLVYTNADPSEAPWIKADQLEREGALVVWPEQGRGAPRRLDRLIGLHERHIVKIALPRFPHAPPVSLGYAILPPHEPVLTQIR